MRLRYARPENRASNRVECQNGDEKQQGYLRQRKAAGIVLVQIFLLVPALLPHAASGTEPVALHGMFVTHIVYFRNDAPERSSAMRRHLTIGPSVRPFPP